MKPQILFEDTHLLVLSKPAGMLSQGDHKGDSNLVDWLREYLGRPYVGLIHRLDRNVSGIMVVAKRTKAARRLTEALQEGKLVRIYHAWLYGKLRGKEIWRHWLLKDAKTNKVSVSMKKNAGSKEAILSVTPLRSGLFRNDTVTLAEFQLQTGRSHQIRAQAAFEGHAILGDTKYAGLRPLEKKLMRPLLHSYKIAFPHPMSGEILKFEAPLPDDMNLIK